MKPPTMRLSFKIENILKEATEFRLLHPVLNLKLTHWGLPKGIYVSGRIFDSKSINAKLGKTFYYNEFLEWMLNESFVAIVTAHDKNRQIAFFTTNCMGVEYPIVPQLRKDGQPRQDEDEWNSSEYNVADTKEAIIIDAHNMISVFMPAQSEMLINMDIIARQSDHTAILNAALRNAAQSFNANLNQSGSCGIELDDEAGSITPL